MTTYFDENKLPTFIEDGEIVNADRKLLEFSLNLFVRHHLGFPCIAKRKLWRQIHYETGRETLEPRAEVIQKQKEARAESRKEGSLRTLTYFHLSFLETTAGNTSVFAG